MKQQSLSWLHISDLHFGHGSDVRTRFDQDLVVSQLLADCRDLYRTNGTPDLIFVTGDIALSARKDQYDAAAIWINELTKVVHAKRRQVIVVPGNHDVDRDMAKESRDIHERLRGNIGEVDELLTRQDESLRRFWMKLEAFSRFAHAWDCDISPEHPFCTHSRRCGLGDIVVAGLNTALSSIDDGDAPTNLALGRGQIVKGVLGAPGAPEDTLLLVLLHHPINWLVDGRELEKLLRGRPHLLFCGHVHEQGVLMSQPFGMPSLQFVAGAGYAVEAGSQSYSWGRLDSKGIRYVPRAWSLGDSAFIPAAFKSDFWNESRDAIEYPADRLPTALATWIRTPKPSRKANGAMRTPKLQPVREQILEGDPWRDDDVSLMAKIHELYDIYQSIGTYVKVTFIIQANSLAPKDHGHAGMHDILTYTMDFRPVGKPMLCHRFGVGSTRPLPGRLETRQWSVRDRRGNKVRTIGLPTINPQLPKARFALLFFDPPLKAGQRYSLTFQDMIENALPDLAQSRSDEVVQAFGWPGTVPTAEIVLFLPEGAKSLILRSKNNNGRNDGRLMTDGELASHIPPPGFRAVGWIGSALSASGTFAVEVVPLE